MADSDSRPNSPGHSAETAVVLSISISPMLDAVHSGGLHCTFAASDVAGQTQLLTYRPGSVPATAGRPPTAGADPATMVPPRPETDGDKPDRILGSPRPKALAVFCPVETAPSLPTEPNGPGDDGRRCLLREGKTNRQILCFNCCCLDFHTNSRTNNEAIIE